MNRRGFLRSLASVPALPLVASLPAATAPVQVPEVAYCFQQYALGGTVFPLNGPLDVVARDLGRLNNSGFKKLFEHEYSQYAADFEAFA